MADPFIGEIRCFTYNYVPYGWLECNGQLLNVSQYQILYAVIGILYGGSPGVNFNLPDFQGKAPMCYGAGTGLTPRAIGKNYGAPTVTVSSSNFPPHTHNLKVVSNAVATVAVAAGSLLSKPPSSGKPPITVNTYNSASPNTQLAFDAITPAGNLAGIAHSNQQPYLPVLMCIAWDGVFPVHPN
ncbi:MAG: tail fiber protein [Desulfuromonadales bacterium]